MHPHDFTAITANAIDQEVIGPSNAPFSGCPAEDGADARIARQDPRSRNGRMTQSIAIVRIILSVIAVGSRQIGARQDRPERAAHSAAADLYRASNQISMSSWLISSPRSAESMPSCTKATSSISIRVAVSTTDFP